MTPTTAGTNTGGPLHAARRRRLPRIAGTARSLVLVTGFAMVSIALTPPMAASAAAQQVYTFDASEPERIDLVFDSDLLAYDLCWSSGKDEARQAVADAIADEMTDPSAWHSIHLSQLTRSWTPLRPVSASTATSRRAQAALTAATTELRDLDGRPVDREVIRRNMHRYTADLDEALADILQRVREMRPGALLTLDGFAPFGSDGLAAGPEYPYVASLIDFVEVDEAPTSRTRSSSTTKTDLSTRGQRAMEQSSTVETTSTDLMDSPILDSGLQLLYATSTKEFKVVGTKPDKASGKGNSGVTSDWNRPPEGDGGGTTNDGGDAPADEPPPSDEPPADDPPPSDEPPADDGGTTDGGTTDGGTTDGGTTDGGTTDGGGTTGGGGGGGGGGGDSESTPTTPTLVAGTGFTTDVMTPGPVGSTSDPNFSVTVTASWSQEAPATVTGPFQVGVAASHPNGIDRVEYSLAGGPWGVSSVTTAHPDSGQAQYAAIVDPAGLTPPFEIRAVAYPETAGQPVALAPQIVGGAPDPGDDGGGPVPDPGAIPVLTPGPGFSGPTPTPGAVGSTGMPGYTATAIARWDVVPYQTFSGPFEIGVVAFHMNEIDRVDFSVDGGPWQSVYEMVFNPRTKVYEYAVAVNASDFGDGPIEVRAIAYPRNAGQPRLLAGPIDFSTLATRSRGEYSMVLYANAGGSLAQLVTVVGGGSVTPDVQDAAVVYLPEGDHSWSVVRPANNTGNRFYTVSGAPGTDPAKVRLTTGGGNYSGNIRLRNLTLKTPVSGAGVGWVDGVTLEGSGPQDGTQFFTGWLRQQGIYATDSVYRNMANASMRDHLLRNVEMYNMAGDSIREFEGMAVNVVIHDLLNLDATHNDVAQWFTPPGYDPIENMIFYNVEATKNIAGQSFFVSTNNPIHRDWAVVNFTAGADVGNFSLFDPMDHFLLLNITFVRPIQSPYPWVHATFALARSQYKNLLVKDSFFYRIQVAEDFFDGSNWAQNNHFMRFVALPSGVPAYDVKADANGFIAQLGAANGNTIAGHDNMSFYDQVFVNAANDDFRPLAGSILVSRPMAKPRYVNSDARNRPREDNAIGALATPQQ